MGSAPVEATTRDAKAARIRDIDLTELFSENVAAKIIQVALRGLEFQAPLPTYPESVPQTGPYAGKYEHREASFWTCGFFPGSIYALLERAVKFPRSLNIPSHCRPRLKDALLHMGRHWSVAIQQMSSRTDTHDMGFIVQPALQKDWELTGSAESLQCVVDAAYALASRWDERVQAIRSWDTAVNDRYSLTDMGENFLVIIDSMCNLDLLYFVAHVKSDPALLRIATLHATTIQASILRPDASSYHLVNFDPRTGLPQAKLTNQGYSDASTWSRGQAWAILGFAQTYTWTRDVQFLGTAMRCAEYFLSRLEEAKGRWEGELVPLWDFDAPPSESEHGGEEEDGPLRDVSAGVIAANGLLVIHQSLQSLSEDVAAELWVEATGTSTAATATGEAISTGEGGIRRPQNYLDTSLRIISQTLDFALDRHFASFSPPPPSSSSSSSPTPQEPPPTKLAKTSNNASPLSSTITTTETNPTPENQLSVPSPSDFDAILRHSTANNNEHAHKRYWDHGLVYADYYLLEFGNRLLRMGVL